MQKISSRSSLPTHFLFTRARCLESQDPSSGNGQTLLHHLYIVQEVGCSHLNQKTFHGLEPNGQGKLPVEFSPVVNYASPRALEVLDEGCLR
jgi:hypothetical protein